MVGLERLDRHRTVAEIFKPQLVEVVATDVDVEIPSPIVLHALVDDGAAGDELLDAVGAVAERRLERGRANVAFAAGRVGPLPPMFRQDVELAQDERHFAIARPVEDEGDLALSGLLHLGDVAVIGRQSGAVLLERLHREDHVTDRDRFAVVVARGGAQAERGVAEIARMRHRFRDQPVFGRHFVERGREQRIRDHAGAGGDRPFEPGDDLVEIVERAHGHESHGACLRRLRVDVIEMLEVRRVFELAEQRQSMSPIGRRLAVSRLRQGAHAEDRRCQSLEHGE